MEGKLHRPAVHPETTALERGLSRADLRFEEARARWQTGGQLDLSGLPPGAMAWLLSRFARFEERLTLVLTPDNDSARATAADLRLFGAYAGDDDEDGPVAVYPSHEASPFLDVAPDRRGAMDRLSALVHLAEARPCRFVVAPLSALLRRVPPKEALLSRSMVVRNEEELDREELVQMLVDGGYLRVPVVEDPGTFAVRGALIDIYPPSARAPSRIELDDWLVVSIRHFDPEDQRTGEAVQSVAVHPVRDALFGKAEIALARRKIRDRCDQLNVPTRAARQLLEELEAGRLYLGLEGLLPGFYPALEPFLSYLPQDARVVLVDPPAGEDKAQDALQRARRDQAAKLEQKEPVFEVADLYVEEAGLVDALLSRDLTRVHQLAVGGAPGEGEGPLARLSAVDPEAVLNLGAEDQGPLVTELKARRSTQGKDDALTPLAARTRRWLESGMRVVFLARTATQAERLGTLLKGYKVPVEAGADDFSPASLMQSGLDKRPAEPCARVMVGNLSAGFVMATEGLVLVTEEEVFGTRAHRRRRAKQRGKGRVSSRAFLEDLRQLAPGDFVVHVDHGVGKYLGLERRTIGLSKDEALRGIKTHEVEVLVVEYAKGDKLFVPVTRLNQLQKHSGGDGHKPKIDRLGGQTFSRTKAKVERRVKQMAEELLRLYAERLAHRRPSLPPADRAYAEFEATFPFEETTDQASAIEDVLADLVGESPMDRIVCGDVGFGKTEVAVRAAFRVAMSGRQVAILCPTTVLAQQHFNTFSARLQNHPLRIEALSRFTDKKRQADILASVKDGRVDVVVGTHRLLSKDVHFKTLGLLVVDEEQRFGVTHKERIKRLKAEVDVLTLTATPIPRTLQLAVGGLRDLSLITTPPVDRRAVRTLVTRWDDHLIREAIQRELSRGGQVFFVYNRIEGLYERAQRLQSLIPDARFAVAHGQMSEGTLERTMSDFVDGEYDVLCSTAIIESGLDIPRANTMLIDRADNFGLAQLYQLRGRVGRSKERAYCYLLTPPPKQMTDDARARIQALERFSQLGAGFSVASLDMEQRGAGDVLGAEQSGTVAAVGFDLFLSMLQDAMAELKGEPVVHDVDTELHLDIEHYLPDDYIEDVGLRLSFYKRFSGVDDAEQVLDLAAEMEERFGPPPPVARQFVRAMTLRPELRALKVLGCDAREKRVTLHLREDNPLDPAKVMQRIALPRSPYKVTPDMKLSRRWDDEDPGDTLDRLERTLEELREMRLDEVAGRLP